MKLKNKIGLAVLVTAWIALPALGAHVFFGQSPVAHEIRGNGTVHEQFASTRAGSIGREREDAVIAATKRYIAAHPDASEAIRAGQELAPVEVLNADLAEHNAKFRVRAVKGTKAQFYEVS